MRKVKNHAVIRRLSEKSFRANRARNRIAILAIALTAMLFSTIFTIGVGTMQSFQRETMRQSGGDCHGIFKNLSWEEFDTLKKHPLLTYSAPCIPVAYEVKNPEFLKRHLEAWYYPEKHYKHCFIEIIDGKAPKKAEEILLDEVSLELMGKKPRAGQTVTLQMQIHPSGEILQRTFTVSGVTKADSAMNVGFAIMSEAYLKKYEKELSADTSEDEYSAVGKIRMDVHFSNSFGIQKKLNKVIEENGYSTDSESPDYIDCNANWAYVSDGAEADPLTVGAIIGALCLILLTGYLIIYNIFQISVMKDIRYYGLLKTVGTTGKQIKQILRRQALLLCFMGIPLGLLAGFFLGKWIVPMFMKLSAYGSEDAAVSFQVFIFAGAAAFALVTVFISIRKPAKIAAKVSPVEAVRYTEGDIHTKKAGKEKLKKTTDGGKIYRMALSNLARSKRKTAIVIVSLSLAIVLLNSIFTVTASFDIDNYLKKFVSSDFLIGNAKYFGLDHYFGMDEEEAEEENLSESFIEACETQKGFEKGGRIYGTETVSLFAKDWKAPEYLKKDESGNYYRKVIKEPMQIDEHGAYSGYTAFYGLEDFPLSEAEVYTGEENPDVIKEKLASGKYILSAVPVDDNGVVEKDWVVHQPGDMVTLVNADGTKRRFQVLSLIKQNYYGLTNRMGHEFIYYTTADVFKEMASEKFLMSYAFDVKDSEETRFQRFLEQYTTEQEPFMDFESKLKWVEDFAGMTRLFTLVGGLLTLVVGLIGILNYINTILTGIVTRQKEFATMEAIGMTKKQLIRMLILEGLYYAGFTVVTSFVLGCLFSFTAVRTLAEGMWFMKYHFVLWPMFFVYPILFFMGAAVPAVVCRTWKDQSLVEMIRRNE